MVLRMRGGRTGTPSGEVFGPLLGPQSVRDGTLPQGISIFAGSAGVDFTQLNPANSATTNQAAITADTTGQVWWPKGNYITPFSGFQLKHGQEHRLECNAGRTRTTTDSAVLNISGADYGMQTPGGGGAGITIKGGAFQSATQYGLVVNDPNTTITDAVFTLNFHAVLIQYNSTISRCVLRQQTHGGGFITTSNWDTVTLEYCELDNNNTSTLDSDGCGIKILKPVPGAGTLICRNNWVHNNYGRGLWLDTCLLTSYLLEENVLENNRFSGLFYEASYGTSTIQRNYATGNGTTVSPPGNWNQSPQMLFSRSDGTLGGGGDIDVSLNWVDAAADTPAIGLVDPVSTAGDMNGCNVHDNDVWLRSTASERMGGKPDAGSILYNPGNNTFENNHYHVPNLTSTYFSWASAPPPASINFTAWKAFGHDDTGTMVLI